jgi:hypothetical protein
MTGGYDYFYTLQEICVLLNLLPNTFRQIAREYADIIVLREQVRKGRAVMGLPRPDFEALRQIIEMRGRGVPGKDIRRAVAGLASTPQASTANERLGSAAAEVAAGHLGEILDNDAAWLSDPQDQSAGGRKDSGPTVAPSVVGGGGDWPEENPAPFGWRPARPAGLPGPAEAEVGLTETRRDGSAEAVIRPAEDLRLYGSPREDAAVSLEEVVEGATWSGASLSAAGAWSSDYEDPEESTDAEPDVIGIAGVSEVAREAEAAFLTDIAALREALKKMDEDRREERDKLLTALMRTQHELQSLRYEVGISLSRRDRKRKKGFWAWLLDL